MYPTEVLLFYCYHCTQNHITPKSLTSTDLLRTILRSFSRPVRGMEFFSPKYGIRQLKAIVRKWMLLDCLLHVANLWNSMFKVPQLPNMIHWAVYHFFCKVSGGKRKTLNGLFLKKSNPSPQMESNYFDPTPSTWNFKTAWGPPHPSLHDFQVQRPPPPPITISIKLLDTVIIVIYTQCRRFL